MKLLLLGVAIVVIVFVVALISPRGSRGIQRYYGRASRKGESKGNTHGGRAGDWAGESLKKVRHAVNRSAESGRKGHYKIRDKARRR